MLAIRLSLRYICQDIHLNICSPFYSLSRFFEGNHWSSSREGKTDVKSHLNLVCEADVFTQDYFLFLYQRIQYMAWYIAKKNMSHLTSFHLEHSLYDLAVVAIPLNRIPYGIFYCHLLHSHSLVFN